MNFQNERWIVGHGQAQCLHQYFRGTLLLHCLPHSLFKRETPTPMRVPSADQEDQVSTPYNKCEDDPRCTYRGFGFGLPNYSTKGKPEQCIDTLFVRSQNIELRDATNETRERRKTHIRFMRSITVCARLICVSGKRVIPFAGFTVETEGTNTRPRDCLKMHNTQDCIAEVFLDPQNHRN